MRSMTWKQSGDNQLEAQQRITDHDFSELERNNENGFSTTVNYQSGKRYV